MGQLLEEMQQIDQQSYRQAPQRAPDVAALALSGDWAAEFLSGPESSSAPLVALGDAADADWTKEFIADAADPGRWAEEYLEQSEEKLWLGDLGDKESEWTKEYQAEDLRQTANELVAKVDDPKLQNTEFLRFVRQIGEGSVTVESSTDKQLTDKAQAQEAQNWASSFNQFLVQTGGGSLPLEPPETDQTIEKDKAKQAEKWAKVVRQVSEESAEAWVDEFATAGPDFQQAKAAVESDVDFWEKLQEEWEEMAKRDAESHPWLSDFDQLLSSSYDKGYQFEEDNPYLSHPDPLSEGVKRMEAGDIPGAVRFFESAVQKEPDNQLAWQYLGTCQAENEQEFAAISALRRCIELKNDNLTALMALAVSFTNESLHKQACETLRDWLKHNPKYRAIWEQSEREQQKNGAREKDKERERFGSLLPESLFTEVQSLYLQAANSDPSERRSLCYTAGLSLVEQTGSDSGQREPFRRGGRCVQTSARAAAWLCAKSLQSGNQLRQLGAHREAVEHFLEALSLQRQAAGDGARAARGPGVAAAALMSDNIWSTLRMALSMMGESSLYGAADRRDLDTLLSHFCQREVEGAPE
ncbi:hypothetical protein WMY93_026667 [Mugilogobius chulae]|uniref:Peroxisomal targeting signal 1 receptor n=1 Tax=Mugilogobius chulae TaxID=88201 RepID=A0AAW0N319_9GOBI